MIIKISDKVNGKDRRREITIQMVTYAMSLYPNSRVKAAEFLGYSDKGLRLIMSRIKELRHFKGINSAHKPKIRYRGGY